MDERENGEGVRSILREQSSDGRAQLIFDCGYFKSVNGVVAVR